MAKKQTVSEQELQQAYGADRGLQTLSGLRSLSPDIGRQAQANALADSDKKNSAWINSEAATFMGARVSELVFETAIKTGVTIREEDMQRIGGVALSELDDTSEIDSPLARMANTAMFYAQNSAEEVENRGSSSVWSEPAENVARRSGIMSLRLLESLGAEVDSRGFSAVLDVDNIAQRIQSLEDEFVDVEAEEAIVQDQKMAHIMQQLAQQA